LIVLELEAADSDCNAIFNYLIILLGLESIYMIYVI